MRVLSSLLSLIVVSLILESSGNKALATVEFRVDVLDPEAIAGTKSGGAVPWEIGSRVGERNVPVTVGVYLDSSLPTDDGAQGWSLSLEAEDCFQIVGATTEGTVGTNARNGGFEKTEIVDSSANGGRSGVVSGVVLDFVENTGLDPDGVELILIVTGRVDASSITAVGQRTRPCEVAPLLSTPYLRGSGVPVETVVTVKGASAAIKATNAEITLIGASLLFQGEFRVDVLNPAAEKGARNGSNVPWEVGVPVGQDVVSVEAGVYLASLLNDQDAGVEAWSFSLLAESCFEVVDATVAGTAAAPAPVGSRGDFSFESTEIVDPARIGNDGRGGVVCAIVLSFGGGATLDPVSDELVLRVTGDMDASSITVIGQESAPCGIRPLSSGPWLRGSGQLVETIVTVLSNSIAPPTVGAAVSLKGATAAFDGEYRVVVLMPGATPAARIGNTVPWTVPVAVGSGSRAVSVRTGVRLVSNLTPGGPGAEAWSLSVEAEDCFRITSATTDGTVGADSEVDSAGKRLDGFARTEIVSPDRNGGRTGVISAVILSLDTPLTLNPEGEELVLRITGDMDTSDDGAGELSCTVRPVSGGGLRGSGQPVLSLVTVESHGFLTRGVGAKMTLDPSIPEYRRGDANNDSTINIADGMQVLGFLFTPDLFLPCKDAADADDNGGINIADAVYVFNFLFSGGKPPAAPGPSDCGPDPTEDDLDCAEYDC